jgi:ribosomal protein S18 acetylase RimI-like enzyme
MKLSEKLPAREHFFSLFETTGWNTKYELTKDELYAALKNSWYCISIYDQNNLVGFGRIISDGIVHALILDVIVLPEMQGEGIGKENMNKLILKCKKHNIRDIQLFCAKDKAGFYEKLGFERRDENAPGMQYQ